MAAETTRAARPPVLGRLRSLPLWFTVVAVLVFVSYQFVLPNLVDPVQTFVGDWLPCFDRDSRSYLTVAIGCTGGRHRSVYLAERLAQHFRGEHERVLVRHRELSL